MKKLSCRILPRGLTFLEMLITVGIVSLIMVAIVNSVLFFYRANNTSLEQSYQIDSARRGIESLVRDLREARHGDDGAYPVASIATSSITFYTDVGNDQNVERVTYTLVGTTLYRSMLVSSGSPPTYQGTPATSTVSVYVRNIEEGVPVFRYYDEEGGEITNVLEVGAVRFVSVSVVVNVLPTRAPEEFTLRTSATLRNLR